MDRIQICVSSSNKWTNPLRKFFCPKSQKSLWISHHWKTNSVMLEKKLHLVLGSIPEADPKGIEIRHTTWIHRSQNLTGFKFDVLDLGSFKFSVDVSQRIRLKLSNFHPFFQYIKPFWVLRVSHKVTHIIFQWLYHPFRWIGDKVHLYGGDGTRIIYTVIPLMTQNTVK